MALKLILALAIGLTVIEATARWWMNPKSEKSENSLLIYQPTHRLADDSLATPTDNRELSTANPPGSVTSLPEIYSQAAPMLRCTSGQVSKVELNNSISLHLAFFEWDGTDTGSVLEAFRHMPEACMGSIGMTLVSKEQPIPYKVGTETLLFDHTIFRDPAQGGGVAMISSPIHAFRAVWVSGLPAPDARKGIGNDEFDRLRTIRLKSALSRFRPENARVIQGAVRGATNPDAAWQAFEHAMLKDLKMAKR